MRGFEHYFLKLFPMAQENNLSRTSFGENLFKTTKLKVILYSLLVWCGGILTFMWARYLNLGYLGFKFYTLFSFFILFSVLIVVLYKTRNIRTASYGLNFLLFFFIPIRVYQTGGVYSPTIALYSAHCILTLTLFGRKKGFLVFLYSLLSVFVFSFYGGNHSLPEAPFYTNAINWGVSVILVSMMILMPTLFIFKEKETLEEKLQESEKNQVSNRIMASLVKQTEVCLSKAKTQLEAAIQGAKDSIEENLMEVELNLRKVDFAVKNFSVEGGKTKPKKMIGEEGETSTSVPDMGFFEFFRYLFRLGSNRGVGIEAIHLNTQFKIVGVTSFLVASLTFFIFFMRGILYRDLNFDTYSILFFSIAMFSLGIFMWKTRKIFQSTWMMVLLLAVAIPFRIYMDGGLEAPITFTLFSLAILVTALFGKELGKVAVLYGCLWVTFFSLFEAYLHVLPTAFNPSPAYWGAVISLNLCFFTLPLLFILEEKDAIALSLARLQKEKSAFLVLRRLNHEIGNSLHVALGNIEFAKEEKDKALLKTVEKGIDDIVSVVQQMSQASEDGRLIKFLEEHQGDVKILEKIKAL